MIAEPACRLGIVGGLGPLATARLYVEICRQVHAKIGITPPILIDSVRMPRAIEESFITAVPSLDSQRVLLDTLRAAVERLAAMRVSAICAACNTVQPILIAEALRCGLRVIGMAEATVAAVRRRGHRSALVLGSSSAQRLDVYADAARAFDVSIVHPSAAEQADISQAILRLTHHEVKDLHREVIASVCEKYVSEVDCVILGCTDLSQILGGKLSTRPVFDSLTELGIASAAFLAGQDLA